MRVSSILIEELVQHTSCNNVPGYGLDDLVLVRISNIWYIFSSLHGSSAEPASCLVITGFCVREMW
jgi:hypothetical protein